MKRIATIGFFDGVHRGHQFLLNELKAIADKRGLEPMVFTFASPAVKALTTAGEKRWLLSLLHISTICELELTEEFKSQTAREFMQWMHDEQEVDALLIGYDHRFGRGRKEGFEDYLRYGMEIGMEVICATECPEMTVSSTMVRQAVTEGDAELAAVLLGREYTFVGSVTGGHRIGHTIGFPTANIDSGSVRTILPAPGVYSVHVRLPGELVNHHGMMNIGTRPTFSGSHQTVEVNIFNFDGDLYGKEIRVSLHRRLRSERPFDSREELIEQLIADREAAEKILSEE